MDAPPRFVGLSFSPWSLKARWALRHHAVPHRFEPYLPMVGEPLLRVALRRPLGRVTVPVLLLASGSPVEGSLAIARFAESRGGGAPLFPEGRDAEVERWNELGDDLSDAGRELSIERSLRDDEALAEAAPPFVPRPLRASVGRAGALYLKRKYAHGSEAVCRERMRTVLAQARSALTGSRYLLGAFSYADVALAAALQFVEPAPAELRFAPLGPASRRIWTDPELARELPELLRWRDALLQEHQPRKPV